MIFKMHLQRVWGGLNVLNVMCGLERSSVKVFRREMRLAVKKYADNGATYQLRRIFAMMLLLCLAKAEASPVEQQRCSLPDKNSSIVTFSNCILHNVTHIASLVPNAKEIYFYDNAITSVDVNAFKHHRYLASLTIRKNDNFTISPKNCFLNSNTLITLDISENRNIPCLSPGVFACSNRLKKVTLLMNYYCECTQKLIVDSNRTLKIVCDQSDKNKYPSEDNEISKGSTPPSISIQEDAKPRNNSVFNITNAITPGNGTKTKDSSSKAVSTCPTIRWLFGILAIHYYLYNYL